MYKNLLDYAIRSFCSKLFYITLKKDNKVNLFQKFMLEKNSPVFKTLPAALSSE